MDLSYFPPLNAGLNATSALLIICALVLVKRGLQKAHAITMAAALCVSVLFLVSYLYYHFHHGSTPFPHQGWIRPVYFMILISHTVLAVLVVPLVIASALPAIKGRFDKHIRVARIAFPVWLYVSVTGVVIYWMLYQIQ
jgi:uncharacterized membrane protein YozB (DUF420 family)